MCGIVGYIGNRDGAALVLEALKRLEYRGYDSAGLATVSDGKLTVAKAAGRIAALEARLDGNLPKGSLAIAHTRWATHGVPNEANAHPHTDGDGTIALVHNGIIENAATLRKRLRERGHTFRSDTDTEVLAHLISELYTDFLEDAVISALHMIEGTYGIAVVSDRDPDTLVAARMGSPILIGVGEGENFVASDAAALLEHTRSVVYLDDGEVAVLRADGYQILDLETAKVDKPVTTIEWDRQTVERGGYRHFMLKEIMEQPASIRDTLRGRLLREQGTARLGGLRMSDDDLLEIERVVITACGTSWHAALIGEYLLEELARLPVEVEYASEFRYRNPILDDKTLVIGISQSGETADTLAALQEAKQRGARTIGIVNVVGSTIARETGAGIYIHAGPEVGVASTKAFTCQLVALALLTLRIGRLRSLSVLQGRDIVAALEALPGQVEAVLAKADAVEVLAKEFASSPNALYLGRGYNFPVALEGALKLKEISYVHAEGYPAAEMKHGPIALIDELMPVVVVAPRDAVYQKIVSNVQEVKARSGRVIAIVTDGDDEITSLADHTISIPKTIDPLTPVLSVLPLQLLAYHIAVQRGCDVDKPRNLAKSVTVE
ncbi:MAG: glutamine--fructose-6-phosphate transaminase (isomerizing) [Gemmatimonadetes bacterium]|nr:glutamine--fructose-6-phosphate transaminase (isomerizing) [Gemmatimonadota bacterium]